MRQSLNINLIVRRITHSLMLAAALERRLIRTADRLDNPPSAAPPAAAAAAERPGPARRSPVRAARPADDHAALLARMPTAKEIASRVRSAPIGTVIASICTDLGIGASHPLWRELHEAVALNGGSLARLLRDLMKQSRLTNFFPPDMRMVPPMPPGWTAASARPPFAAGAGPP